MNNRPNFLQRNFKNGVQIIADFRALTENEAAEVDGWLLQAAHYGSLTWQERALWAWINEVNPMDDFDTLALMEGAA